MNQPVRAKQFIPASQQPEDAPREIFKTCMYALTRTDGEGRMQFATVWGWCDDIVAAQMWPAGDQIGNGIPSAVAQEMDARATRVHFKVAEQEVDVPANSDAMQEVIIVARKLGQDGKIDANQNPRFITNSGCIGRDNEVSDRVWQAVPLYRDEEGSFQKAFDYAVAQTTLPYTEIKVVGNAPRHSLHKYEFSMATRRITFEFI